MDNNIDHYSTWICQRKFNSTHGCTVKAAVLQGIKREYRGKLWRKFFTLGQDWCPVFGKTGSRNNTGLIRITLRIRKNIHGHCSRAKSPCKQIWCTNNWVTVIYNGNLVVPPEIHNKKCNIHYRIEVARIIMWYGEICSRCKEIINYILGPKSFI